MPEQPGTLETLATELGHALAPLQSAFHSPEHALAFFEAIGLPLPAGANTPAFQAAITELHQGAHALGPAIDALAAAIAAEDQGEIIHQVGLLLEAIVRVVRGIDAIVPVLSSVAAGIDPAEVALAAKRILDLVVIEYLEENYPVVLSVLELFGVAEVAHVPEVETGTPRPAFDRRIVHYERIPELFTDPLAALATAHRWGQSDFDGSTFIPALATLIDRAGIPVSLRAEETPVPHYVLEFFLLRIRPLFGADRGLEAALMLELSAEQRIPLALGNGWEVAVLLQAVLSGAVALSIRPPAEFSLTAGASAAGALGFELGRAPTPPDTTMVIFGKPGGTRLEMSRILASVLGGFRADTAGNATGEFRLEGKLEGGKVVLVLNEIDGFLKSIMPSEPIELAFDFGLGWSSATGFFFSGSASLETTIVVHQSLGPLLLESISLGLRFGAEGISIDASASGGGQLGPVSAAIDRIGITGLVEFRRGNLGEANFDIRFKPPTGIGVSINAGPVSGGGFVSLDYEKGRYAGILQLSIMAVSVTAIGIIDTKLPDGREGFSFLVIIAAKFTPIQLGFGFTLNGVGGLLGIHRTVVTDALRDGLRTGTLDHILFPEDPVAHANELIRDLSTIFPPATDRYVFGPMVIIGWGTPTLVEAKLGILIEVPDPVRIVLLGQIDAYLPTRDAALVELHLDVLGILDFGQKLFSLDASLHDSRIALFSLFGDMAMRLSWGDNPSFAFSLGGLHPQFAPPPGFPSLRRLTVALGAGDYVRISLETYFAITSNSLQFGAKAELFAGDPGSFNVYGWLGFDALFIFSPFSFRVDINAGVAIRIGTSTLAGIRLAILLEGPSPWHIKGEACISILFFDICVPVEATWGDETPQELPTADPWLLLAPAIREVRNWSVTAPPNAQTVAVIETPAADADKVLLDPFGGATWREKVVPLNRTITKFGEARPPSPIAYEVTDVALGGSSTTDYDEVTELFAPAQFQDMSDADKLSAPSFEPMDGGLSIDADGLDFGPGLAAEVVYQSKIIDEDERPLVTFKLPAIWQIALAASGSTALSPLKTTGLGAFGRGPAFRKAVALQDPKFVAVAAATGAIRSDVSAATTKSGVLLAARMFSTASKTRTDEIVVAALHDLD